MNILQDENLSAADQQAIDRLQSAVEQLTPAGRRKLLALVARLCLPTDGGTVELANEEGEAFAYLCSSKQSGIALSPELTPEELADVQRGLLDPKNSRPWREVLAELDSEDDRE